MQTLVEQALLVLSAAALAAAAFRAASLVAQRGLERLVGSAVLAVAAAVAEALALGRLGLAGSPVALSAAAAATWLLTRALLPAPALSAGDELSDWRASNRAGERVAALAAVAAAFGLALWGEYRPVLGFDGATYHLSQVVIWVQAGSTGSIEPVLAGLPVGNYPITNEVALAWTLALSQGFAPVAVWSALLLLVLVGGSALGLRALGVPAGIAALAIAALCTSPLVLRQIVQAETDFPALAWLAACAGLCAAAVSARQPRLLALALVAAGLAIGTKTTTAPLALLALGAAGFSLRAGLRPQLRLLLLGAAAAFAVGGLWYLRNLLQHGSPLWPLLALPWGDAVPPKLARVDASFLDRPGPTLSGAGASFYLEQMAGLALVFATAVLSPLWARKALPFAGGALLAAFAWANAPFTGNSGIAGFEGAPLSTFRYATPALAAGVLALAASSRAGQKQRRAAGLVFALALGWNLARYLADPFLPSEWVLVIALAGGALGLSMLVRANLRPAISATAAMAAAALTLTFAAHGWVERHAATDGLDAGMLNRFAELPGWKDGSAPVAASPFLYAGLAGDRLDHRLQLVPARESCAETARRLRRGWVVSEPLEGTFSPPRTLDRCLRGVMPAVEVEVTRIYGSGGR